MCFVMGILSDCYINRGWHLTLVSDVNANTSLMRMGVYICNMKVHDELYVSNFYLR